MHYFSTDGEDMISVSDLGMYSEMTLNEDGTVVMSITNGDEENSAEGTWKAEAEGISATIDGGTQTGVLQDGFLLFDTGDDGMLIFGREEPEPAFELADPDEDERALARLLLKQTLSCACDLGARVVVTHAGYARLDGWFVNYGSDALRVLILDKDGKPAPGNPRHAKFLAKARERRRRRAPGRSQRLRVHPLALPSARQRSAGSAPRCRCDGAAPRSAGRTAPACSAARHGRLRGAARRPARS